MATFDTEYTDLFAYDMAKNTKKVGEAINEEAINVSIENILLTNYGERIFLPDFGSPVPLMVFETLNETNGEILLNNILEAIKKWESRITLIEEDARMNIKVEENMLTLIIPYQINRNGLTGTFSRKIIL